MWKVRYRCFLPRRRSRRACRSCARPAKVTTSPRTTAASGLSLRRHPLALLRRRLEARGAVPTESLWDLPTGRWVRTAGLVITRQRPGSASGVTFVTMEDETGHVNLIVWKRVAEEQRAALLGSRLLEVEGAVQREGDVLHVIARRLRDLSALLGDLAFESRDFR